MSLESTHPQYDEASPDWVQQRDLYAGESVVKKREVQYLPATPSMILDGMCGPKETGSIGRKVYEGYLKRALFPDYVSEAVETLVGMLNHKPPTIELPAVMEPLRKDATLTHESLEDVLRRIHCEQLITGRIGLLADLPESPDPAAPMPYLATYTAESITNWDEAAEKDGFVALNLVVLNESGYIRDTDFSWKTFKKYRVLQLGDLAANESEQEALYLVGIFSDIAGAQLTYNPLEMKAPMIRGNTLKEIPFVFINTRDLLSTPDKSPTLGLGKQVLAIYRGEADYRQSLFMTGQDTLVVVGGTRNPDGTDGDDDALRTGAGSRIDVDMGGDAKYIGVNSQGLTEQREALQNDRRRAETKSGQLIEQKANKESGEALKTRLSAQTATLNQIAITAARGLETVLKICARWLGADPEEVVVKPNMEFGELQLSATDITGLMTARLSGAPLSKKSIHELLVQKRLTTMTYEEEMQQIQDEDADMPRTAAGAGTLTAEEQLAAQKEERRLKEKTAQNRQRQQQQAGNGEE